MKQSKIKRWLKTGYTSDRSNKRTEGAFERRKDEKGYNWMDRFCGSIYRILESDRYAVFKVYRTYALYLSDADRPVPAAGHRDRARIFTCIQK